MHLMVICSTLFFLPKGHIKEIQMKTQTIHVDTIDAQLPPKTDTGKLGHVSTVDPQKYSLLIISSSPKTFEIHVYMVKASTLTCNDQSNALAL